MILASHSARGIMYSSIDMALETVVTFASPKEKEEDDGGLWKQADIVGNIYQDINGDFARQCADPFDFAALTIFVSTDLAELYIELILFSML